MSETKTHAHGYVADKERLVKRLHRIEGQVRGIERMIEDDRYCIDVITQISAVTTALESLAFQILDEHVNHCVADALASGDPKPRRRRARSSSKPCTASRGLADEASPPLPLLVREADAECDEHDARHGVDHPPNRAGEQPAHPGYADGVEREPPECQRAEEEAEREERDERAASLGRELGKQAREEDRHLRVSEIADQALPKRACRCEPARVGDPSLRAGPPRYRRPERLSAEVDEVRGACKLERSKRRLGGADQRDEPGARGECPDRLAESDACRRRDAAACVLPRACSGS